MNSDEIINALGSAVIATDPNGVIVFANPRAEMITGMAHEAIIGFPMADVLPSTSHLVAKCLSGGEAQLGRQSSDTGLHFVVNVNCIRRGDRVLGSICHFIGLEKFESPAFQLKSHQQLNRQLQTIFDSSSDGIWVCDGRGKVIDINRASERLNGVRAAEMVGAQVQEIVADGLIDTSVTLQVLETRRQVTMMQYVSRTNKHLLVTGTPAFDENGELFLVVINERDMTALNAIREELQEKKLVTERYRDQLAELSMLELEKHEIVAESEEMQQVLRIGLKLARLDASNILVLGESGTGKGLIARFIHRQGKGNKKPFIQINCAALPETLLEAELFGYEKGAFTGARQQGKVGLFELAHGGTLFLDEIGDLPFSVQAKLLTYLDDHEIMRIGGIQPKQINCTVIAATNRDLETLAHQQKFRQDLFYRLSAFTIRIPPLRERPEDILQLLKIYLDKYNLSYGLNFRLSPRAMAQLQGYPFPGNVRELKNMLKEAMVMSDHEHLENIVKKSSRQWQSGTGRAHHQWPSGIPIDFKKELRAVERELIEHGLRTCTTTRQLARFLGISQPSVVRKLKEHKLTTRLIRK